MKNKNEDLFYLRDSRGDVGSSAMFWALNGAGYTSDLSKAQKYPRERAIAQYNSRETDIPVRCDLADSKSYLAVDMQLLPEQCPPKDFVYLVKKNCFDGNNILFYSPAGNRYNFHLAFKWFKERALEELLEIGDSLEVYDCDEITAIARPVVKSEDIKTRDVLRKAKIKMVKVKRYRPTSGKHRLNCQCCGRIVWDYNPYEPVTCINCRY